MMKASYKFVLMGLALPMLFVDFHASSSDAPFDGCGEEVAIVGLREQPASMPESGDFPPTDMPVKRSRSLESITPQAGSRPRTRGTISRGFIAPEVRRQRLIRSRRSRAGAGKVAGSSGSKTISTRGVPAEEDSLRGAFPGGKRSKMASQESAVGAASALVPSISSRSVVVLSPSGDSPLRLTRGESLASGGHAAVMSVSSVRSSVVHSQESLLKSSPGRTKNHLIASQASAISGGHAALSAGEEPLCVSVVTGVVADKLESYTGVNVPPLVRVDSGLSQCSTLAVVDLSQRESSNAAAPVL